MGIGLLEAREVAVSVYKEVQRTRVFNVAAGLSYYFLLSLFPLLILLATLLGYLPIPRLFDQALDFAARFVPSEAMGLVQKILRSVLTPSRGGLLSLGVIGTLWAASGGFSAMIDALDIAYDSRTSRPMLKQRLLAIGLTFMTGGLMALAMLFTLAGDRAGHFLSSVLHLSYVFEHSWGLIRWGIIVSCIVLSMELLYFFGPNIQQRFKHTLPGAVVGTALWILISAAVNIYISHFANYNKTYGTIGAVIALMFWLYVSSIAILIGAELNSELLKVEGKKLQGQQRLEPGQPAQLPKAA
ncbi:MAG TPA: YihY/virulence factor BrkB family protein [Terriglobales bacterium]|nr:YihY/virulence factor BrkB family protein [Terriglobales bacterium]